MDSSKKKPPKPKQKPAKNKAPAPVQITTEQILRQARELRDASQTRPPKHQINDPAELAEYQSRKRKEFEDQIQRTRGKSLSFWAKYAEWEYSQHAFDYARSVWQRAIAVGDNYRNPTLWIKYAKAEMENKFIYRARNVWEQAVENLPRVDQLWCKHILMEHELGNVAGARQIYQRWMGFKPDEQAWISFMEFELKYHEVERARTVYEGFVQCHPKVVGAWIKYADFETENGEVARARNVYERALATLRELADDKEQEQLLVAFAQCLERCQKIEQARSVYILALDQRPTDEDLYDKFVSFEKQQGDRKIFENVIVGKRRFQYENEVRNNPLNYDSWFDYIRLEESAGNKDRIREIYERAIGNVPPALEKRYWKRYIYLWINYALYQELEAVDMERAREVYGQCLKLIPHRKFSFSKIWLLAAQFEIRQLNLKGARQVLGNAIGMAPKAKIFDKYIKMELQLGNIDRCRKLYIKYLEWSPQNCHAWIKYAELENILGEKERARMLFEEAIGQPQLDMPELLWKTYLDFEISEKEFDRTRKLYERLLDRTMDLKVWISYAKFEAEDEDEADEQCIQRARGVFERADNCLNAPELKEARSVLLEEWLNMEASFGDLGDVSLVNAKLPMKLKRKRPRITEDGRHSGFEEYIDYHFPEEPQMTDNIKILEAAYRWKKQKCERIRTFSLGMFQGWGLQISQASRFSFPSKHLKTSIEYSHVQFYGICSEKNLILSSSIEICQTLFKFATLSKLNHIGYNINS